MRRLLPSPFYSPALRPLLADTRIIVAAICLAVGGGAWFGWQQWALAQQAGSSSPTTAGRWVPYDAYARPYSWPVNGHIIQNYGFTEAAQNLGLRYPTLYPKGDPGVIFSTSNHVEPPPNPTVDKYINPNIDIAPNGNDPLARAVYSTQAGWITFADWAGESKGYTIQVESDVDGDGQADLATRYMRLQAPTDGYFAPDIATYRPATSPETMPPPTSAPTGPDIPPPFIVEAESMNHDTTSDLIHDSSASGGLAMRMRSDGDLSIAYNKPADQITVRAKGDQCGGEAPTLVLKIDGNEFDRINVPNTDWADFTVSAPFNGANHTYSISYINDFIVMGGLACDRNAYIDKSTFIVTNPNTVISQTLSEQLIEAESLTTRTTPDNTKPVVKSSATASDGKYVFFADNGSISDDVTIEKGNWIMVRAKSTECEGSPHMVVKLDDTTVLEADVTNSDWMYYSTLLNLPAGGSGQYQLAISFSNDKYLTPWCDRNLDVDAIKIQDNTVSQSPNNAASLIGKTKYVGYNQLLGYVSAARDHEREGANYDAVPNANQTYLSYRIMYNNPNFTTFPSPDLPDAFINARVDNPYIIETDDNTVAGSLKVAFDHLQDPMWFFCALRTMGNSVKCIDAPNPY